MKKLFFCFVSLVTTLTAHSSTLCESDEIPLFSCRTESRIISLCRSKELTDSSGYMEYRYGKVGHVEMIFPKKKSHPKKYFTRLFLTGSHGSYEASANFRVGDFDYSVYSALAVGSVEDMNNSNLGDYGPISGVLVKRRDKELKDIRCVEDEVNHDDPRQFDEKLQNIFGR